MSRGEALMRSTGVPVSIAALSAAVFARTADEGKDSPMLGSNGDVPKSVLLRLCLGVFLFAGQDVSFAAEALPPNTQHESTAEDALDETSPLEGIVPPGTHKRSAAPSSSSVQSYDQTLGDQPVGLAIHAIESINPGGVDYSDLTVIGDAIGGARIVMLGEASHGGGSTFLAKTRLIKFLHEEMNFNVLAFESGFYDVAAAQSKIGSGDAPSDVLGAALTRVWAQSRQLRPLMQYLDRQADSANPLRMAGFDFQFTNQLSRELPDKLQELGSQIPGGGECLSWISGVLRDLFSAGAPALQEIAVAQIEKEFDLGIQSIGSVESLSPHAVEFWKQVLRSTESFLVFVKRLPGWAPEVLNMRDAQMARNLIWLAETKYPEQKIIVWAATSHVIKDRSVVETDVAREMVPMGAFISERFGSDAYVLAFTSFEGKISSFGKPETISIGTAPEESIEAILAKAAFSYSFADTSDLREYLPSRYTSWAIGFKPMNAPWDQVVDGFFFVRTVKPSEFL